MSAPLTEALPCHFKNVEFDVKTSEKQIELSPCEQRICELKELLNAKEKEIQRIRLEISAANSSIVTSSGVPDTLTSTSSLVATNSFTPSVTSNSNTSFVVNNGLNQAKKIQQKKRSHRNFQTFKDSNLPFIPNPSDQLFRQLCGLETVVDRIINNF